MISHSVPKDIKGGVGVNLSIKEVFENHGLDARDYLRWGGLIKDTNLQNALKSCRDQPIEEVAEFISKNIAIDTRESIELDKFLIKKAKAKNRLDKYFFQSVEEATVAADRAARSEYLNVLQWFRQEVLEPKCS